MPISYDIDNAGLSRRDEVTVGIGNDGIEDSQTKTFIEPAPRGGFSDGFSTGFELT